MRSIRVETFDGKLRYELSPDSTDKIYVDGKLINPKHPKPSLFLCKICNGQFDTRTAKGKMHMAGHGRNLEYALKEGLAERVE